MRQGRRHTVLLVEDEPAVLIATAEFLRDAGFEVLDAEDAAEALGILKGSPSVDVLVTDIGLPGKGGMALAREAARLVPALRVVFTSGRYLMGPSDLLPHVFVAKPYRSVDLIAALRRVLARPLERQPSNEGADGPST